MGEVLVFMLSMTVAFVVCVAFLVVKDIINGGKK